MDAAKLDDVGLLCSWLDMTGEGKTKLDRTDFEAKTSLSATDNLAACCLAALDWGLRCADILARVCRR